jgi:hypothetical protein
MKTKVTLSEQELRRLIRATLLEADDDTAALDSIPFDEPLDLGKIGATGEIDYLLNAFNQFSPDDIVISPAKNLPTAEKTPKAIKAFLEAKESSYVFTTPAWPGSGTIDEQRQVAFEYLTLLLKCKIIDLLNDKSNTVNPRFVFFIDDTVYRRDQIEPGDQESIQKLSNDLEIATPPIQFNTPAFFDKLGDRAFVEAISNPDSGKTGEGPLANVAPTSFYISQALADKYNKKVKSVADAAVARVETLLRQFDTDFVETFFCTPLVFPDVWKKYCFDSGHPLSTPWRQSYVIMNIASQAASVAGGAAALYSKLMSYYTQGASVQQGEKVGQQNPFAPSNMFRSLQESKKILVTLDELKRVISAALQLHERDRGGGLGGLAADALRSAGEGIAGIFKRTDVEGAEAAARSLARAGIRATGRYATEITAALTELPDLAASLRSVEVDTGEVVGLRQALNAAIKPSGASREVARVKEVVVDTLVKIASEQTAGKKLDTIMIELIGGRGDVITGDLSKIQNWSRPLRDYAARMLTDSASNDILTGQGAVSSMAESLSGKASTVAGTLKNRLEDAASVSVAALDASGSISFDLAKRQFMIDGAVAADLTNINTGKVRAAYGPEGVKLVEDAQRYVKQIDALNDNKIIVGDAQVDIAELLAKSQIDATLTGANDALRSALISPAIARKAALVGEFSDASEEVSVGIRELDKYRRRGTGTEIGLYRGIGGKFGRSLKRASPIANVIFGANKIVLAAPVRVVASTVRAAFGDTTLIGRLADTVATSGLYQNLIGLAAFSYIANMAAGTTPGTRDGGILNALDMIISDGPVSAGIGNFMLAGIAEAVDSRINRSGNAQIAAFLQTDPFAAYQALGDAIKAYYDVVDVDPLQFPDLTSTAVDAGYRAGVKTAIEKAGEALGLLSAVTAGDGDAANNAVANVNAAAAALDPLITTGAGGKTAQGNDAWQQLESARESATSDLVVQLSESSEARPGGSSSGVASYSPVLTKYYTPTTETATFDPVSQTLLALSAKTIGAEASAGDFAEFFGYFSGNDRALATLGMTPSGTVTAQQITDINTKLKELGDKFDKLKRLSENTSSTGDSTPAPPAPAAP